MSGGADPQRVIDRLLARGRRAACRGLEETAASRTVAAQDAIETGSQVTGADDEYA